MRKEKKNRKIASIETFLFELKIRQKIFDNHSKNSSVRSAKNE